jgi:hypothetical protein
MDVMDVLKALAIPEQMDGKIMEVLLVFQEEIIRCLLM